jgi:hypothetical protein
MSNITIEDRDTAGIVIWNPVYENGTLKFPVADTYVQGTILAKKVVADAITVEADAGNTGDGTVTLATVAGADVPLAGAWNFELTAALIGKLEDPSGRIVESNIAITDGGAIVLNIAGLQFTVTDGATAFVAGDKFSLTVATDGDYVIYDPDGVGGAQIPTAILTIEEVATAAADVPFRALISGRVRREKLVIDDGTTVSDSVIDQLRDFTIIGKDVDDKSILDNS